MDLSFSRRAAFDAQFRSTDLSLLLARTSAVQAASPTARAQVTLDRIVARSDDAARIAIFTAAADATRGRLPACFATRDPAVFGRG